MKLAIVNGSLGGASGNTAKAIQSFCNALETCEASGSRVQIDLWNLKTDAPPTKDDFEKADAFLFTSGVYWDSWGSPMQIFFETLTPLEGDACFFGKPAAALVTMHSVGGKEVLSRLQGVLNTFGLFIPPMGAMTYSFVNQVALEKSDSAQSGESDLWCLDDMQILAKNLLVAVEVSKASKTKWASWPVDREDPKRVWLKDRLIFKQS